MRDYQTKSNVGGVADSISATRFGGGEFNSIAVELENAVESSDQTLAPADGTGEVDTQLAMAMSIYGAGGAAFCADTGAADAYVIDPISPKEAAPDYFDGMTLYFIAGNVNTGASTVNYNSLGVKNITLVGGVTLPAGEISGITRIVYDLANDRFEIVAKIPRIAFFSASGSWNVPNGVYFATFRAAGAGGGAAGQDNFQGGGPTGGSAGGTTTVVGTGLSLSATGGGGGLITAGGVLHGTGSGGTVNLTGSGGDGGINAGMNMDPTLTSNGNYGTVGGNGGYCEDVIPVTPADSYTITIGAGGAGGAGVTSPTFDGEDGEDGYVVVIY